MSSRKIYRSEMKAMYAAGKRSRRLPGYYLPIRVSGGWMIVKHGSRLYKRAKRSGWKKINIKITRRK